MKMEMPKNNLLEKRFLGGKRTRGMLPITRPMNVPTEIRHRFEKMNAAFPGWNKRPSVELFYDEQLKGQLVLGPDNTYGFQDPSLMQKDSPLTNADSGAFNAIYGGASAVIQVAQSSKLIKALPQTIWPQSGFRTAYAAAISTGGCGVAYSSDRPATIEPTYMEIGVNPKECAVSTELSDVLVIQGETDDAVTFSVNKAVVESNVLDAWDYDMLVDGNTLAGNNFESIDRITASSTTSTNLSWTAADEDLYSVDRSTYTWFNANSYDASGTDRYLARSHLDVAIAACMPYWEDEGPNGKFILTDQNTRASLESLEEAKQHLTTGGASFGVNGVQTLEGQDGGVVLAKYKGFPIVYDKNVQADDIGRIYLLDTNHTYLSMGRPMEFVNSDNALIVGFNNLGMWHWIGELMCDKPATTASIRDLKD